MCYHDKDARCVCLLKTLEASIAVFVCWHASSWGATSRLGSATPSHLRTNPEARQLCDAPSRGPKDHINASILQTMATMVSGIPLSWLWNQNVGFLYSCRRWGPAIHGVNPSEGPSVKEFGTSSAVSKDAISSCVQELAASLRERSSDHSCNTRLSEQVCSRGVSLQTEATPVAVPRPPIPTAPAAAVAVAALLLLYFRCFGYGCYCLLLVAAVVVVAAVVGSVAMVRGGRGQVVAAPGETRTGCFILSQ